MWCWTSANRSTINHSSFIKCLENVTFPWLHLPGLDFNLVVLGLASRWCMVSAGFPQASALNSLLNKFSHLPFCWHCALFVVYKFLGLVNSAEDIQLLRICMCLALSSENTLSIIIEKFIVVAFIGYTPLRASTIKGSPLPVVDINRALQSSINMHNSTFGAPQLFPKPTMHVLVSVS